MRKEKIKLAGMTIVTALMVAAVSWTFPVRSIRQDKERAWALGTRIYVHREDTDFVWLSDGEVMELKEVGKEDRDKICGRILLSSTEGFR